MRVAWRHRETNTDSDSAGADAGDEEICGTEMTDGSICERERPCRYHDSEADA